MRTSLFFALLAVACSSTTTPSGAPDGGASADAGTPDGGSQQAVLPPTSVGRIDVAREEGRIDEKTAAFYELLAELAPDRLPTEFQGESAAEELPSYSSRVIAKAHLSDYDATQAEAVRALLASPADPNWLKLPAGLPKYNAGDAGSTCWMKYHTDDGVDSHLVAETKHFAIRALAPPADVTIPRVAEIDKRLRDALDSNVPDVGGQGSVAFGDYLDHVYDYYLAQGLKDPVTKASVDSEDGQRKLIAIYVATCDGADNQASATGGFILSAVQLGFEEPTLRRVVLPHELFHLIEGAYREGSDKDTANSTWPYEAWAVAMEDEYAPDVRRWSGFVSTTPGLPIAFTHPMDRMFKCPEEPIHRNFHGYCRYRNELAVRPYGGDYSRFILLKYLMRNAYLPVSDFWETYAANGGNPMPLIDKDAIPGFELALMAEISGENPAFAPADRAFFHKKGQESLDFDPGDHHRYTFHVKAGTLAKAKGFRVLPEDELGNGRTPPGTNAMQMPILPLGTHRFMVDVPDAPSDPKWMSSELGLVFRPGALSTVQMDVMFLGDDQGAPTTSGEHLGMLSTPVGAYLGPDGSAPVKHFLVQLVNLGESAVPYAASVSIVPQCNAACADGLADWWVSKQCPETTCVGVDDVPSCIESYGRDWAKAYFAGWCPFLCGTSTDRPFDGNQVGVDFTRSAGVPAGTVSGFFPLKDWPTSALSCDEFVQ